MPYDLSNFDLSAMLRLGLELRRVTASQPTMEASAQRMVQMLYDEMRDAQGRRQCVLVRCYKTHLFGKLDASLQRFAQHALTGDAPTDGTRCLTLIATAGDQPSWNDRRRSMGHQAIPLTSVQMVERAPMIAQLVRAFGLDIKDLVSPSSSVMGSSEGKTYNVFHVENAVGSPYIPAQAEFVIPYGVKAVLGFGGSLRDGELYAAIMFSRVPISTASADRFRTIALDAKAVMWAFGERVFGPA